jgi:hypothetical protein
MYIYIYVRNPNEKSMFLIVSNSFDENVEITCIYIYCVFSPSFLSDVFEVYIYQKSQGNVYIYTCNHDMF